MKFIYFVFVVFSVVLDQVYSDRESSIARRSQVRNREYYASVPVVVVYDDSANRNKKAASSTEGKLTTTLSATETPEITTLDLGNQNETVESSTEKILLPDEPIVPKILNQARRSNRRNVYQIPVAVVYDSATETHTRRKLEALSDTHNPVTVKNIRQRGRKRFRDQQDNALQQLVMEVKRTTQLLEEVTINPIESNSLPKETDKTKTIVRRRKPSKESQRASETTPSYIANEPTTTEKILNASENILSPSKEPINYQNPTEMEIMPSSIDKSLQNEKISPQPIFRRRRPTKEGQRVVQTTQSYNANGTIVTENILNVSENMNSLEKQPIVYKNFNRNPTELVMEMTTLSIDDSLKDEQIFISTSKNDPIIQQQKAVLQRRRPSKDGQRVVQTTKSYDVDGTTVTENILNSAENIKSSKEPIIYENFKANPTDPAIEATTSSIDESLQDEQIFVSSPKTDPKIQKEKSVTRRRRPSKEGLKVVKTIQRFLSNESTVTENQFNVVINENVKTNSTELVMESTTSSTDALLQDEQVFVSSTQKTPTILEEKLNKVQRRTRTRVPVVPIVNSQNFVYQNGDFHYSFEGGDGTKKFENGVLKHNKDDATGEAVEGGYSYKDKDGKSFSLTYTADENGYRPVGAHLPTPPPIPPAIARALRYLATKPTPADYDDVTEKLQLQVTENVEESQDA